MTATGKVNVTANIHILTSHLLSMNEPRFFCFFSSNYLLAAQLWILPPTVSSTATWPLAPYKSLLYSIQKLQKTLVLHANYKLDYAFWMKRKVLCLSPALIVRSDGMERGIFFWTKTHKKIAWSRKHWSFKMWLFICLFVSLFLSGGAFRFYSRDFSEHADLSRVETAQAPFSETAWKCSRDTGSLRRA